MKDYTGIAFNTSSLLSAKNGKAATITGAYDGQDEGGTLLLSGGTAGRFISGDTNFENLTFYGSAHTTGTGSVDLYVQGHKVKFGSNIIMDRYIKMVHCQILIYMEDGVNLMNNIVLQQILQQLK